MRKQRLTPKRKRKRSLIHYSKIGIVAIVIVLLLQQMNALGYFNVHFTSAEETINLQITKSELHVNEQTTLKVETTGHEVETIKIPEGMEYVETEKNINDENIISYNQEKREVVMSTMEADDKKVEIHLIGLEKGEYRIFAEANTGTLSNTVEITVKDKETIQEKKEEGSKEAEDKPEDDQTNQVIEEKPLDESDEGMDEETEDLGSQMIDKDKDNDTDEDKESETIDKDNDSDEDKESEKNKNEHTDQITSESVHINKDNENESKDTLIDSDSTNEENNNEPDINNEPTLKEDNEGKADNSVDQGVEEPLLFNQQSISTLNISPMNIWETDPRNYRLNLNDDVSGARVLFNPLKHSSSIDITYSPEDDSVDPWANGELEFYWNGSVGLDINLLEVINIFQLITIMNGGLGFAVYLNLPDYFSADSMLEAINYTSSELIIGNSSAFSITRNNFRKVDDSTLELTIRPSNSSENFFSLIAHAVWDIITTAGMDLKNFPVSFRIQVDVETLTANGHPTDESEGNVLTKGKLPPSPNNLIEGISVDFYPSEQVANLQQRKTLLGIPYWENVSGAPVYVKPDQVGNPKISVTDSVPTWSHYISPWDNEEEYNVTTIDGFEEVTGVTTSLPGSIGSRELTLDLYKHRFNELDKSRFYRVVNFFDRTNETDGASLDHTPTSLQLNTPSTVSISGKDNNGIALSPVNVKVLDEAKSPELKLKNMKTTEIAKGKSFDIPLEWKGETSKSISISYSLDEGAFQEVVESKENNNNEIYHDETITIPAIKNEGYHKVLIKIGDNYNREAIQSLNITVLDMPVINGKQELSNLRTEESGSKITAITNEVIRHTIQFENESDSNVLYDPTLNLTLPTDIAAEYVADSLTVYVNGEEKSLDKDIIFENGKGKLNLGALLESNELQPNDEIMVVLNYRFKNIFDTKITIPGASITGTYMVEGESKAFPLMNLPQLEIEFQNEELTLNKVPESIQFGVNDIPTSTSTYNRINESFAFQVIDTLQEAEAKKWQINATLISDFQTSSGDPLFSDLIFTNKKGVEYILQKDTSVPAYVNDELTTYGVRNIEYEFNEGLNLRVIGGAPIKKSETYTAVIEWNLSEGPKE
ncbi:hypothetical protein [Cytobacillus sp. FSL K6-0265]|uniref:hypothetical protein n=1 Tax=Cytobacillus sp. FSL K6-0265 TaxID=2921448 RepID=UPI0030F816B7